MGALFGGGGRGDMCVCVCTSDKSQWVQGVFVLLSPLRHWACNQPRWPQTPNTANKICMGCLESKLLSKDLNFTHRNTKGGLQKIQTRF